MFAVRCTKRNSTTLMKGLNGLATLAAQSYGPKGEALSSMNFGTAPSMSEYLRSNSEWDNPELSLVRDRILPLLDGYRDGVKTALILADALYACDFTREELAAGLAIADECAYQYLNKAAMLHQGVLPGGGLWLLGLARPLARKAEKNRLGSIVVEALALSVKRPLLALAATTGLDIYDIYAQIKLMQPNQFYSLCHLGLHGGAAKEGCIADIPCYGIDVNRNIFCNVWEEAIVIPLETAIGCLTLAGSICKELCNS